MAVPNNIIILLYILADNINLSHSLNSHKACSIRVSMPIWHFITKHSSDELTNSIFQARTFRNVPTENELDSIYDYFMYCTASLYDDDDQKRNEVCLSMKIARSNTSDHSIISSYERVIIWIYECIIIILIILI